MKIKRKLVIILLFVYAVSNFTASDIQIRKLKQNYIEFVKPFAKEAEQQSGISSDFMIAQSALETGWGRNVRKDAYTSKNSNNYFNIKKKISDNFDFVTIDTKEFLTARQLKYLKSIHKNVKIISVDKKGLRYCTVIDQFRAYLNVKASFLDYAEYLSNSARYRNAMKVKCDVPKFAIELQKSGYATAPNYAENIIAIWDQNLK